MDNGIVYHFTQIAAMRMGGLTKLATLGRGPTKQLTTCLSVFVLEMAKGSGLANLWVSLQPPAGF